MIYIFATSFALCLLCILASSRFHFAQDTQSKPQRLHSHKASRLGGIGIFGAFLMSIQQSEINLFVIIGLGVVFLGGLLEDILGTLKPTVRLAIQIIGLAIMLQYPLGVIVHINPFVMPFALGFIFSIFAIVGVCNSINIIDGLNGLSSGICILVLLAIYFVAKDVPTLESIANLSLISIFSTLGFLALNFPFGRIFLGDGGAYFLGALIGFMLGIMSNLGISAWLGLCLMIYPIYEVIFSIFRRKIAGKKAMKPDSLHLHSLLFKLVKNNSLASAIILIGYSLYIFAVVALINSSLGYILASIIFCVIYTLIYKVLKNGTKIA